MRKPNLQANFQGGLRLKTARISAIAVLCALPLSCAAPTENAAPGSTSDDYSALYIASVRWDEGPEPRIVVRGDWSPGVSTPPTCEIVQSENGSDGGFASGSSGGWREREGGVIIEGGKFSQEFVAVSEGDSASGSSASSGEFEYQARCRISQSTGRTVEATAPLRERSPAS